MISLRVRMGCLVLLCGFALASRAQIDPQHRRLVQIGYNQPLEGRGPIAAYGFFYLNRPEFLRTNLTLRLAIAPVYLDAEFGFRELLGPRTDVGIGVAGGGFAQSYSEIRQGTYRRRESFLGHGGEVSSSIYHRLNPDHPVPAWFIVRGILAESFYEDDKTDPSFELPQDRTSFNLRTGLRLGGQEPSLTGALAVELSLWHETQFRANSGRYGFADDRAVESNTHLFWGRSLFRYLFGQREQLVELSLTAGSSLETDRFSAYRLGGILPFVSEFPLNIPGYYYQELSAKRFALINGMYSFSLDPAKNWRVAAFAATGPVQYLKGLDQDDDWHTGVGGGFTYISPSGAWFVSLLYGHGFNALRDGDRGANQVALLFQFDFDAKQRGQARWFVPGTNPYRSGVGERIFR